jgi:hypothetical protein
VDNPGSHSLLCIVLSLVLALYRSRVVGKRFFGIVQSVGNENPGQSSAAHLAFEIVEVREVGPREKNLDLAAGVLRARHGTRDVW